MKVAFATPARTRSVRDLLDGRMIVVAGDHDALQHVPLIDASTEALAFTSSHRFRDALAIKHHRPEVVTIIEPKEALGRFATPEHPLVLPADGGLFAVGLERVLDSQRESGADIAMTPTGYIRAGEPDTLRAVVDVSRDIARDDTLHRIFLAPQYLHPDNLRQTRAILRKCELPIALAVASKSDPMTGRGVVEGLRDLVGTLDWAMLWRGDLAVFDTLAHGARAAAIGTLTSTRHGVAPDQLGQRSPHDATPSVLLVDLGAYMRSGRVRDLYAGGTAPGCPCTVCKGRSLDRFEDTPEDRSAAMRHNHAAMRELRQRLSAGQDPRTAWYEYVDAAIVAHETLRATSGVKLTTPTVLRKWASRQPRPVVSASTVSSNSQDAAE